MVNEPEPPIAPELVARHQVAPDIEASFARWQAGGPPRVPFWEWLHKRGEP